MSLALGGCVQSTGKDAHTNSQGNSTILTLAWHSLKQLCGWHLVECVCMRVQTFWREACWLVPLYQLAGH